MHDAVTSRRTLVGQAGLRRGPRAGRPAAVHGARRHRAALPPRPPARGDGADARRRASRHRRLPALRPRGRRPAAHRDRPAGDRRAAAVRQARRLPRHADPGPLLRPARLRLRRPGRARTLGLGGRLRPLRPRGRRRLRHPRVGGAAAVVRRPHRGRRRVLLRLHDLGDGGRRPPGAARRGARRDRGRHVHRGLPQRRPLLQPLRHLGDVDQRQALLQLLPRRPLQAAAAERSTTPASWAAGRGSCSWSTSPRTTTGSCSTSRRG